MNHNCDFSTDTTALSLRNKINKTEFKDNKIINIYDDNSICGKSYQCNLFSDTWIIYYNLKMLEPAIFPLEENGGIRFNYCIAGRCEMTYKNNKVIYIGNGDFISAFLDQKPYQHDFPLGMYRGFSIVTSLENLDEFLNRTFNSKEITGKALLDKLKSHDEYLILSNNEKIKTIMEDISYLKDVLWKEKAIVALTQLVVFLLSDDIEVSRKAGKYFDTKLSNKVKYIKKEVTNNIEKYVSIEGISKNYNISARTFSDCFKEIYGTTYYAFIKEYRIKKAAELLVRENNSITEIALAVGYQNPGKFSKAFYDVMGITPLKFRKNSITGLD